MPEARALVGDSGELNFELRVSDRVGEYECVGNALATCAGENVVVGENLLAFDEHVEDALFGVAPKRLGFEQRRFVDALGAVEEIPETAGRITVAFPLVKRIGLERTCWR